MGEHPHDEDCIFCRIVDDEIPARTVHEGPEAVAFLDVNPLAPGHTLVIPRGHYETIQAVPDGVRDAVFDTLGRLVDPIERAVEADGSTVGFNNGAAAGQEVPHVHGHVIPRFDGDGGGPIHDVIAKPPSLTETELDDILKRIEAAVDE